MQSVAEIIIWSMGIGLALVWTVRLMQAWRGLPLVPNINRPQWDRPAAGLPALTVVVPAKNEARSVEKCLRSLIESDYPGLSIVALDDRSTDSTGAIMDSLSKDVPADKRLRVIHITELPQGWLGKVHAMWTGAKQTDTPWILFTDGDVIFRKDALRRAIAFAEESKGDHLVVCPLVITHSAGERMMISFCQALFVLACRAWKIPDPKARDHIGAGAFNLIRRDVYEKLGSFEVMRLEVVDDLKLGKAVKQKGFAQRIAFGDDMVQVRWAEGAFGVVNNLTKNSFAMTKFNVPLSMAGALVLWMVNAGPFFGALFAPGWSRLPYIAAIVSIAGIYSLMRPVAGFPARFFLTHWLAGSLLAYAILKSIWMTVMHDGVQWRGTKYSLDELRAFSKGAGK